MILNKTHELYKVEGDKIKKLRKECERCGNAVYMAEHKDRLHCGKCGFTIYKKGKRD